MRRKIAGISLLLALFALCFALAFTNNSHQQVSAFNNLFDDKTPNQSIPVGVLNFGDGYYFYLSSNSTQLKSVRINLEGTFSDSEVISVAVTTFSEFSNIKVGDNSQYVPSNPQNVIKNYTATGSFYLSKDELTILNRSGLIAVCIAASTSLDHYTSVTVKATVEI